MAVDNVNVIDPKDITSKAEVSETDDVLTLSDGKLRRSPSSALKGNKIIPWDTSTPSDPMTLAISPNLNISSMAPAQATNSDNAHASIENNDELVVSVPSGTSDIISGEAVTQILPTSGKYWFLWEPLSGNYGNGDEHVGLGLMSGPGSGVVGGYSSTAGQTLPSAGFLMQDISDGSLVINDPEFTMGDSVLIEFDADVGDITFRTSNDVSATIHTGLFQSGTIAAAYIKGSDDSSDYRVLFSSDPAALPDGFEPNDAFSALNNYVQGPDITRDDNSQYDPPFNNSPSIGTLEPFSGISGYPDAVISIAGPSESGFYIDNFKTISPTQGKFYLYGSVLSLENVSENNLVIYYFGVSPLEANANSIDPVALSFKPGSGLFGVGGVVIDANYEVGQPILFEFNTISRDVHVTTPNIARILLGSAPGNSTEVGFFSQMPNITQQSNAQFLFTTNDFVSQLFGSVTPKSGYSSYGYSKPTLSLPPEAKDGSLLKTTDGYTFPNHGMEKAGSIAIVTDVANKEVFFTTSTVPDALSDDISDVANIANEALDSSKLGLTPDIGYIHDALSDARADFTYIESTVGADPYTGGPISKNKMAIEAPADENNSEARLFEFSNFDINYYLNELVSGNLNEFKFVLGFEMVDSYSSPTWDSHEKYIDILQSSGNIGSNNFIRFSNTEGVVSYSTSLVETIIPGPLPNPIGGGLLYHLYVEMEQGKPVVRANTEVYAIRSGHYDEETTHSVTLPLPFHNRSYNAPVSTSLKYRIGVGPNVSGNADYRRNKVNTGVSYGVAGAGQLVGGYRHAFAGDDHNDVPTGFFFYSQQNGYRSIRPGIVPGKLYSPTVAFKWVFEKDIGVSHSTYIKPGDIVTLLPSDRGYGLFKPEDTGFLKDTYLDLHILRKAGQDFDYALDEITIPYGDPIMASPGRVPDAITNNHKKWSTLREWLRYLYFLSGQNKDMRDRKIDEATNTITINTDYQLQQCVIDTDLDTKTTPVTFAFEEGNSAFYFGMVRLVVDDQNLNVPVNVLLPDGNRIYVEAGTELELKWHFKNYLTSPILTVNQLYDYDKDLENLTLDAAKNWDAYNGRGFLYIEYYDEQSFDLTIPTSGDLVKRSNSHYTDWEVFMAHDVTTLTLTDPDNRTAKGKALPTSATAGDLLRFKLTPDEVLFLGVF